MGGHTDGDGPRPDAPDDVPDQALLRELDEYRARFEQASLPQVAVGLDARLTAVNPAFCEMVGRDRADLIGRDFRELVHPTDSDGSTHHLNRLLDGIDDSGSYAMLGRHADGSTLPVLLEVTMLRDADGSRRGMAVFVHDLTEVRDAQQRLQAQLSLFRALNRRSSDAALVTDAALDIMYVSPAATDMFGFPAEDVIGANGWEFVHPDDVDRLRPLVDSVLGEPDRTERFTIRIEDSDGSWRWVEETLTNCLADPDIGGMVVNLRDITERVLAEQSLRESEARYRTILRTALEGIVAVSADQHTVFANERLAEITGIPLRDIYDKGISDILPEEVARTVLAAPGQAPVEPQVHEISYLHPDGTTRVLSIATSPLDVEGDAGLLTMVSDVTDARRTEDQLRWQALHDPLTDLPNRALLMDRIDRAVVREERTGSGLAVMFLDLDGFKKVNDRHGHHWGDRLLQEVATRLAGAVRQADTVARLGGDEFAVICEGADEAAARRVAGRIRRALRPPIVLDGVELVVSASIGIALTPPHGRSSLLQFADTAMYAAKGDGGDRVAVFQSGMVSGG